MSENKEKVYPECEKLASHEQELNTIRNFLDWCDSQRFELRDWNHLNYGEPQKINKSREQLLAEYLGIDLKVVEKERQEMLEDFISGK